MSPAQTDTVARTNSMSAPGSQLEKRGTPDSNNPRTGEIMAVWARLRDSWSAMSHNQRKWTAIAAISLVGVIATLTWLGLRTEWRVVYAGLDPEDARQVGLALTQAQIPFELADNGMTLRVPASQLDKARLSTASKAIRSGRMGFELFDKPNWVGSEFDEQVNYQRALEGELEHTVSSLSDVQTARVHLVLPHDSLFRNEQREAKASVVLKLRRPSLAEGEADSIRNLIASAVDGLTPDHVVLIDASGRLALGPKTPYSLRLEAEQALEEKIISTLEAATGPGNVRASVNVEYNPESLEETSEIYDPAQSATLSMERTDQTTGGQPVAAGVPGTASNASNSQPLPVFPKQSSAPQTSHTESGTYGVSKTMRHKLEGSGRVRRVTAAVVVNDRQIGPATKGNTGQWQPRSAEEIRNLTSLAQAAIGYDTGRGDVVTVQGIAFEVNRHESGTSLPVEMLSKLQASPELLKYAVLLFGIALVLVLGVRPALRRAMQLAIQEKGSLPTDAPRTASEKMLPAALPAADDVDRLRANQIFERVTNQIKSEPGQSSRLLQSWIHSE